ncbi:hypothetical protein DAI22_09g195550 [Oryza sativa Japonica Group]|nr:hypothetical protein DAI22_09g195550 [Oryza sativa Japonica Group]
MIRRKLEVEEMESAKKFLEGREVDDERAEFLKTGVPCWYPHDLGTENKYTPGDGSTPHVVVDGRHGCGLSSSRRSSARPG